MDKANYKGFFIHRSGGITIPCECPYLIPLLHKPKYIKIHNYQLLYPKILKFFRDLLMLGQ